MRRIYAICALSEKNATIDNEMYRFAIQNGRGQEKKQQSQDFLGETPKAATN